MSTEPTVDPRTSLPAAIATVVGDGDLEDILDRLLGAAVDGFDPAFGAIVVADPDRAELSVAASTGLDSTGVDYLQAGLRDPADPFATTIVGRIAVFDREEATPDGRTFIGAYLPLVISSGGVEACLGALGLTWPAPHELDEDQRASLRAITDLAALSIDRARLVSTAAERSEWFERMAHADPLTGLANERTIARILELELARAGRQGSELSLAMFDVDDFRATNREGGHEAGDDVLRRVAAVLAESVRLVDTVGRVGGDEFILVAPGSAGATVAKRVLDGISALPAVAGRQISVSAGVARFPSDAGDAESLIAAAKDGLSRARAAGPGVVASGATQEAGS